MALYFKHPVVALQEFGILLVPLELLLKININLMLEATLMERAKTEFVEEKHFQAWMVIMVIYGDVLIQNMILI